MITFQILEDDGVLIVEPKGPLTRDDFDQLTAEVDLYLARREVLGGLLIHMSRFPGWEDFSGMAGHFRFVRDHHRRVRKVALASDSTVARIVPTLAEHFVSAEIKRFEFDERDAALEWLRENP